jgi:hypothetical protein
VAAMTYGNYFIGQQQAASLIARLYDTLSAQIHNFATTTPPKYKVDSQSLFDVDVRLLVSIGDELGVDVEVL